MSILPIWSSSYKIRYPITKTDECNIKAENQFANVLEK